MCCQLHIAALIAEYLKLKGTLTWGADTFAEISKNIPRDETGLKIDEGKSQFQLKCKAKSPGTVNTNRSFVLTCIEICAFYCGKRGQYQNLHKILRFVFIIPC